MYHGYRMPLEFPFLYARGFKIYFKNNFSCPRFYSKQISHELGNSKVLIKSWCMWFDPRVVESTLWNQLKVTPPFLGFSVYPTGATAFFTPLLLPAVDSLNKPPLPQPSFLPINSLCPALYLGLSWRREDRWRLEGHWMGRSDTCQTRIIQNSIISYKNKVALKK